MNRTNVGLLGPVASGNHLSAANDEPEPTEADWVQFDCERNINKGERLARLNAARAFALQMVDLDAMRRAGL